MQHQSKETLQLMQKLGELVSKLRKEKYNSIQQFAYEYGLDRSHCSKIERGKIDCKITSFYRLAQALEVKPSKLMSLLEKELGEDFSLIDE